MKAALARADAALVRVERALAGVLFLAMALVMFVSVVHRIFSRPEGRLASLAGRALAAAGVTLPAETVHGPLSAALTLALTFAVAYGALRTMKRDAPLAPGRAAALAAGATVALALAVQGLLRALPNGLVWGPVVSLGCMLWVGFLGASIATYEKRHLALEMGEKLWPARVAPWIKALAMAATAAFCLFLLALSILSIQDHHRGWSVNHLAGNLLPTAIPKWVVFLIFPYTFVVMTLRFLGAALAAPTAGPGSPPAEAEEQPS